MGNRYFYLTNRANGLELMSKGVLLPQVGIEKHFEDVGTLCPAHVLLFCNAIPRNLVEEMAATTGSVLFPIAFEVKLPEEKGSTLASSLRAGGTKKGEGKPDKAPPFVLKPQMMPLSSLVAIHVQRSSYKEDLVTQIFSDVPTRILPIEVSPQIFQGKDLDRKSVTLLERKAPRQTLSREDYRCLDSAAGAAIAMAAVLPSTYQWLEAYRLCFCPTQMLSNEDVDSREDDVGSALRVFLRTILDTRIVIPTGHTRHAVLLQAFLLSIRALTPEKGWPAIAILLHIRSLVEQSPLSASDKLKCNKLMDEWQDVLDNIQTPGDLSDDDNIVERGILLTLLQPEIRIPSQGEKRSLRVGPGVEALRSAILGAYFGLGRLPYEMKSPKERYMLISDLTVAFQNLLVGAFQRRKSSVKATRLLIEMRVEGSLNGVGVIDFSGVPLVERALAPNDQMMELYYAAKNLGFDFEYDFKNCRFKCIVELNDGRTQKVFLSQGRSLSNGLKTIRVISPCWRPEGNLARSLRLSQAIDLLARNNSSNVHCRFALDLQAGEVTVEVDQIFETMDPAELRNHILEVALLADTYEALHTKADDY